MTLPAPPVRPGPGAARGSRPGDVGDAGRLASPPARRARPATWRDPRLAVGLLLVGGSVVAGAQLLAGAEQTTAVLTARVPIAAGQPVESSDLAVVRLRFADAADAERYLPADADVAGAVLLRPVGPGELVPRAAVGPRGADALAELPLALDAGRVPATVRVGSTVDVWAAAPEDAEGAGRSRPAVRLLEQVPVLALSRPGDPGSPRQVVVGVPAADLDRLGRIVAGTAASELLLVGRP